ncbi:hypothetical protein IMZ48_14115 [Candidatus Bathyarchaeota archaeon]|nr:hypothetical protein [Candidatus Bathyarchaeota archaeon]
MEYYDLGSYRRKVTTTSADAQMWFDRGLAWSYSFNHEESLRCFRMAAQSDPHCAMAYWGAAYAMGPNYNKSWIRFDAEDMKKTSEEAVIVLEHARKAKNAEPAERALIEAMSARFPSESAIPGDPVLLNQAYADAMARVFKDFGEDMDIAVLYADALMCIRPRQLWDLNTGKITGPDTVEAIRVLEVGLAHPRMRNHPAVCHLYIHAMEMSPFPEKAQVAADRLRRLVPDGSHMQHMSTHIDIACGDYRRGIDSNHDAMVADDKYFSQTKGSILYTAYRTHNISVLVYAAMMAGRSEPAISAAKRLPEILTPEILTIKSPPMVDWTEYQTGTLAHVLIRFGRWEEILELDLPTNQQLYSVTTATICYARGIALAALQRVEEAEAAKLEFYAARDAVPVDRQYGLVCSASTALQVASSMLEGELEYRRGNYETAFAHLRKGIELEDALPYADPPAWMLPVRHALGALLLEQGLVEEATELYKQDLGLSDKLPRRKARINNMWGLHGLYECFRRSGQEGEARKIRSQRDIAVASADVPVISSCFCRLSIKD